MKSCENEIEDTKAPDVMSPNSRSRQGGCRGEALSEGCIVYVECVPP